MSVWSHAGFLLCVALATFAQNTTGFAFGLLLIGLTSLLRLAPVETVANVSSVLALVNAVIFLRRGPELAPKLVGLILFFSLLGVVAGVELLNLLGEHERALLQLLLGLTIVVCSFLLVVRSTHAQKLSGWISFGGFAALSGVMGGLFSSAGPPLVYHLYRQPLNAQVVRETLILVFAVNAFLRMSILTYTQSFDLQAVYLALEAVPVVFLMTLHMRRRPSVIDPKTLRLIVFTLLLLAGISLAGSAFVEL